MVQTISNSLLIGHLHLLARKTKKVSFLCLLGSICSYMDISITGNDKLQSSSYESAIFAMGIKKIKKFTCIYAMNQTYCKLETTKLVEGPLQLQGHDKDVFYPYPIASGPLAELAVSWHNTT